MKRPPLTPLQEQHIDYSLKVLCTLAYAFRMEYQSIIDIKYPMPIVNNHNKRILESIEEIQNHLKTDHRIQIDVTNLDTFEEYAGKIVELTNRIISMPLEEVLKIKL
jgi:hypothetical protein